MLHEYISKWFLAGTPLIRGTNLWYQGKQYHKYERCLYLFHCWRAPNGVDIWYRLQYSLLFPGIGRNNPPPSSGPFSRLPQQWPSRLNVLDVKRAFFWHKVQERVQWRDTLSESPISRICAYFMAYSISLPASVLSVTLNVRVRYDSSAKRRRSCYNLFPKCN